MGFIMNLYKGIIWLSSVTNATTNAVVNTNINSYGSLTVDLLAAGFDASFVCSPSSYDVRMPRIWDSRLGFRHFFQTRRHACGIVQQGEDENCGVLKQGAALIIDNGSYTQTPVTIRGQRNFCWTNATCPHNAQGIGWPGTQPDSCTLSFNMTNSNGSVYCEAIVVGNHHPECNNTMNEQCLNGDINQEISCDDEPKCHLNSGQIFYPNCIQEGLTDSQQVTEEVFTMNEP